MGRHSAGATAVRRGGSARAVGVVNALDAWAEPQLSAWWPVLAVSLTLGASELTALQLALSVSHVAGAAVGGWVAARVAVRRTLLGGMLLIYGGYLLAVTAGSVPLAAAALCAAGLGNGAYNVAQRGAGSAVESSGGRRHSLGYYGICAAAVVGASASAGGAVGLGLGAGVHILTMALCTLAVLGLALRAPLPELRPEPTPGPVARLPWRGLWPLAGVAALAGVPIGIAYTRGAEIMVSLGVSGGGRTWALTAYAAAEAVTLAAAWWVSARVHPQMLAALSGPVAVVGALMVCHAGTGAGTWPVALVGMALVGAGLACHTPLAVSLAGERFPAVRARAVGLVTTAHLLAVASAPALVLAVSLAGVGGALAAGLVMTACTGAALVWALHAYKEDA